ncbi:MAG TPA: hypothetical protein VF203_15100 [Burkholderiales bacterium]
MATAEVKPLRPVQSAPEDLKRARRALLEALWRIDAVIKNFPISGDEPLDRTFARVLQRDAKEAVNVAYGAIEDIEDLALGDSINPDKGEVDPFSEAYDWYVRASQEAKFRAWQRRVAELPARKR